MTSKLICPFCRRALARHGVQGREYGVCRGENCPSDRVFLPIEIWQALIQAKQDLEIARKALKDMMESGGDGYHIARKALKQIEHKES